MAGLDHHTLRSGKTYAAFELVVGSAIQSPEYFSVADCLKQRLEAQELTGIYDEEEDFLPHPSPSPPSPLLSTATLPESVASPASLSRDRPATSALEAKKQGSKRRKRQRREHDAAVSDNPELKNIYRVRRDTAGKNTIQVDFDTSDLPHSKPAWLGSRTAQDGSRAPNINPDPSKSPPESSTGMGGVFYTQDEINALSNTEDFRYVRWFGEVTIPIIDAHRRLIALLGGKPKDLIGWKIVTDAAAELMARLMQQGHFSNEQLHHRRAQEPYPSVSRGVSHGGGQLRPGELCNNKSNTKISDELLASVWFQRISGFTMCLFMTFGPMLFAFYVAQMTLLADWDRLLQWPFLGSVFAACTFNFGPHAITVPHLDFGNLSWGWCAITALGNFDPDRGGHLILWDLKLIIRFPPGSTILIPSALIRHSNIPVSAHERRYSFTQYTAGGLFRWIRNGFKTDEDFEATATKAEKAARTLESKSRWEEGVKMFSIIDDFV